MSKIVNFHILPLISSTLIILVSCSTYIPSTNYSNKNYDEPFVMSSTFPYRCTSDYSSYDKLDVEFPTEPSCISTVSISSSKRESIANYNQCVKDLKEYAGQLDQWINCKNEKALKYAKQKEEKIVNVYNTSLQEAKQHIQNKQSPDDFYPSQYMEDNPISYNTCSMFITSTDQCTYKLPEIPHCLLYNGFTIDNAQSCLYDLQLWQSSIKDWLKNQSDANIEIAKLKLKKLSDDLQFQGSFL